MPQSLPYSVNTVGVMGGAPEDVKVDVTADVIFDVMVDVTVDVTVDDAADNTVSVPSMSPWMSWSVWRSRSTSQSMS